MMPEQKDPSTKKQPPRTRCKHCSLLPVIDEKKGCRSFANCGARIGRTIVGKEIQEEK